MIVEMFLQIQEINDDLFGISHIKFPTQNIVVRDITYKLSTAYQIENQRL